MTIRNVAEAQRKLIIVIACLAVIVVAALGLLFSPPVRAGRNAHAELKMLRAELEQKRVQAIPALDMDKKLSETRTEIADFYSHEFPSRYSEISEALSEAATESHVELANVTYAPVKPTEATEGGPPASSKLTEVNLSLDLGGSYESEIRFINALERSKMLMVIESVNLAQSQGGNIRLSLRLQTYLRAAES